MSEDQVLDAPKGFVVTCNKCGATECVFVDNTEKRDFGDATYGGVDLVCRNCKHEAPIWNAW